MRDKLPRELRDQIYEYLVSDPEMRWNVHKFRGISTASDEQFVNAEYKIFFSSYVGIQVARKAGECYYATNQFRARKNSTVLESEFGDPKSQSDRGLPFLSNLLKEDYFGLDDLPCKSIRRLCIEIHVSDMFPAINKDFHDYYDDDHEACKQAAREERLQLDKLYEDIESMSSLLVDKDKLDLRFYIDPIAARGRSSIYRLNVEHTVLNVLEAIRSPVYDLIHTEASVAIRR